MVAKKILACHNYFINNEGDFTMQIDFKAEKLSKERTAFLDEQEHTLLRNILNEAMQQKGTSTDEYEDTLNSLHTKICLYFMEES